MALFVYGVCVFLCVSGLFWCTSTHTRPVEDTPAWREYPWGAPPPQPPPPVGAQRRTYPCCFFKDSKRKRGNSFSVLVIRGKWRSECTSAARMGPFAALSSPLSSILCLNLSALDAGAWLEMRLLKGCVISALSHLHNFFCSFFFIKKNKSLPKLCLSLWKVVLF